jgi:hypothetical protein
MSVPRHVGSTVYGQNLLAGHRYGRPWLPSWLIKPFEGANRVPGFISRNALSSPSLLYSQLSTFKLLRKKLKKMWIFFAFFLGTCDTRNAERAERIHRHAPHMQLTYKEDSKA